jgi:hypothetical protein
VFPQQLQDRIVDVIDEGWTVPGIVTILTAREADPGVAAEALYERTAGVQFIYEGLRLTRTLSRENPWPNATDDIPTDASSDVSADMDLLAADVLVARGAYLLTRTEASDKTVDIIRTFGFDETTRQANGVTGPDSALETDALDLAVIAGGTVADSSPPESMVEWADDLSASLTDADLPQPGSLFSQAGTP